MSGFTFCESCVNKFDVDSRGEGVNGQMDCFYSKKLDTSMYTPDHQQQKVELFLFLARFVMTHYYVVSARHEMAELARYVLHKTLILQNVYLAFDQRNLVPKIEASK